MKSAAAATWSRDLYHFKATPGARRR